MNKVVRVLLASVTLIVFGDAHSVDGVIEINQARALAGGVSAEDTAGFPVTISESGSYILTGNLTVADTSSAIVITANGVTLDLNGFSVEGPVTCTDTPVTSCTNGGSAKGIDALSVSRIIIRNGSVRGFGQQGVLVGFGSADGQFLIDGVMATENGNDGFKLGTNGVLRNCVASRNAASGVAAQGGSLVTGCVLHGNASGIFAFVGSRPAYSANVISANGTNVVGTPTQLGSNICDGALCP